MGGGSLGWSPLCRDVSRTRGASEEPWRGSLGPWKGSASPQGSDCGGRRVEAEQGSPGCAAGPPAHSPGGCGGGKLGAALSWAVGPRRLLNHGVWPQGPGPGRADTHPAPRPRRSSVWG